MATKLGYIFVADKCEMQVQNSILPLKTRNSSGDEIVNVNFITTTSYALQDTIDSFINSATDRRGYMLLVHRLTKFPEITQCHGHYAVRGHSRSPILVPTNREYIYDFLLVINTNLPPILHRFQVTVDNWSNFRWREKSASL